MASNVTRDHHNLRRNLKLNDNFISNDGEALGINMADEGHVMITSDQSPCKFTLSSKVSYGNSVINFGTNLTVGGSNVDGRIGFGNDSTATDRSLTFQIADTGETQFFFGNGKMMIGNAISGLTPSARLEIEKVTSSGQGSDPGELAKGVAQPDLTTPNLRLSYDRWKYVDFDTGINGALTITTVADDNCLTGVDDLTRPGNHDAWEINRTWNVQNGVTSGSGDREKFKIVTDGDGYTTFTLVQGGRNFAVDETITFTDPGETDNTAVLTVASISSVADIILAPDGNVGIGNSVPGSDLEISKVSGDASIELSAWSATDGDSGTLIFQKSSIATVNTFGDGAGTAASETLGRIEAWGTTQDGTAADDIAKLSSYIEFSNDSASREGTVPGKMIFAVAPNSDNATPAEAMRITQAGNVGIGVTDPDTKFEIFGTSNSLQQKWSYDADSFASMAVVDASHTTIATGESGNIILDAAGDIRLDAAGGDITILQADVAIPPDKKITFGNTGEYITGDGTDLDIVSSGTMLIQAVGDIDMFPSSGQDVNILAGASNKGIILNSGAAGVTYIQINNIFDEADYFKISCATNGATTIATVDDGADNADLTLNIDGFIDMNSASGENITLDSGGDITLDADGDNITMLAGGTGSGLDFIQSGTGDYTIKNLTSDKDIIFNINDGGSDTEIMRLDGDVSSLLIASGKKIAFADSGETISGDGTDLTITSGGDVTIDAEGDIVLDAQGGNITLLDGGSTYTPSATSDATTKAYVDANMYHFIRVGFDYSFTAGTKIYLPMAGAESLRETTTIIGNS